MFILKCDSPPSYWDFPLPKSSFGPHAYFLISYKTLYEVSELLVHRSSFKTGFASKKQLSEVTGYNC